MSPRLLFTALFASILVLAACKPSSDTAAPAGSTAPAETATSAPAPDAHTDVISEIDNSPAPEGLDVRAFAGSFRGTLPCADCPGIDSTIELKADGTYALHEVYQERKDASRDGDGTWTAEDNGRRIRLDPNSKSEGDRLYAVVSNDELQMLDARGNPPSSGLDYSLHRSH